MLERMSAEPISTKSPQTIVARAGLELDIGAG